MHSYERIRGCLAVDESKVNTGKWTPREIRLRLSRVTLYYAFIFSITVRAPLAIKYR